jgi:DNA-binding response OmpR family regulator
MEKKILIVEDDTLLGEVLVKKLEAEGYATVLVQDGAKSIEKMREEKPDLVLLDILLPHKNGYEILEEKKNDPALVAIPTIIISNSGQAVEIERALDLGVKDYLVKVEFDPNEVIEKVHQQLGSGTSMQDLDISPTGDSVGRLPKGTKVVVVEDDRLLSDLLARRLSEAGCLPFHSLDGSGALKLIREHKPDIVVLDILLPGIDGFEVLLLSNLGQERDIKKGQELGSAGFLVKATVTLEEIIDEIQRILANGQS